MFRIIVLAALLSPALHAAPISVTVDDLPLQAMRDRGTPEIEAINRSLLRALKYHRIEADAFVNASKPEADGRLYVNRLNADWFDALATRLKRDGHHFVSLEKALRDPAYASKNQWTGAGGISWLHRWALARGMPPQFYAGEPRTPE